MDLHRPDNTRVGIEISFCIVSTDGRQMLLRSISAVGTEREVLGFETEVLVLDNGV
jgi:N-acetylglucosaminyl-diphospho-decaprenol L-rhamnosyltransferase